MRGRLLAIPDIHGRLDLLEALMQRIDLQPEDQAIFLGDYIDRGPDSRGVLDYLQALKAERPTQVEMLGGNHEWLMIDALSKGGQHWLLWMVNGGGATMRSFENERVIAEHYATWLATLPLQHEEPGFFFSHAPVHALADPPYRREVLTWSYWDLPKEGVIDKHHSGRVGVCGHIHRLREGRMAPRFYDHYIYCDCGCGCLPTAPLVAVNVRDRSVISVSPADSGRRT